MAVGLPLLTLITMAAHAASPIGGKVVQARGPVSVNGHPAHVGTLLKSGDLVQTGTNGRTDLFWTNGVAMRLMPESRLRVGRWDDQQEVSLLQGGLLSVLRHGSHFSSRGPGAVAAVTGTVYFHEESPAYPGYICVCEGVVHVTHARHAPAHRRVVATHHTGVQAAHKALKPAGMFNHSDQDVADLKRLFGAAGMKR